MTCGLSVKRPHDYESHLSSDVSIEVKRSRKADTNLLLPRLQISTFETSPIQSTSDPTFPKENFQVNLYLLMGFFLIYLWLRFVRYDDFIFSNL